MRCADLSIVRISMINASRLLENRMNAPKGLAREIGEYNGKFYLVDPAVSRVFRLTRGAYRHLRDAWMRQTTIMEQMI